MEAASAAAVAVRGGSLVRARAAYRCAQGPRPVLGAGLAARGRRRVLVAVAALPEALEPLPSHAQEGTVEPDDEKEELDVHGDAAAAETSSPSGAPGKTVRVRFVLKKQCPFGQSFHLVGDDPALGLWDPVKAVALQWAEGHEWIVEKDLPANKLVEFKFLLRDSLGKLQWQNGPNRSLQTGETVKTLVICEDWGDVNNQRIEEEGEASLGMEDAVVSDDNEGGNDNVVENELQMDDDKEVEQDELIVPVEGEKSTFITNGSDQGELMNANKSDPQQEVEQDESIVPEEDEESTFSTNDSDQGELMIANKSDPQQEVEQDESIVPEEDEKSTFITNDSDQGELMNANKSDPQQPQELKMLGQLYEEIDRENGYTSCTDGSYAEKIEEENTLSEVGVPVENGFANANEHDFLWGWKALQQLLMNLVS